MEDFEIGTRFPTYELLMEYLEKFCEQTKSKFWKRDARTITASRTSGVRKFLNPDIVYFEIKFSCIYGGMEFKSKSRNIRPRHKSLKANGCPAYLRFKASEDGEALQLVAKNLNHNHELKVPEKKRRATIENPTDVKKMKHIKLLEELETVEVKQKECIEVTNLIEFAEVSDTEYGSEMEVKDRQNNSE